MARQNGTVSPTDISAKMTSIGEAAERQAQKDAKANTTPERSEWIKAQFTRLATELGTTFQNSIHDIERHLAAVMGRGGIPQLPSIQSDLSGNLSRLEARFQTKFNRLGHAIRHTRREKNAAELAAGRALSPRDAWAVWRGIVSYLLTFLVLDGLINGFFFGLSHPLGLIGGISQAMILAAVLVAVNYCGGMILRAFAEGKHVALCIGSLLAVLLGALSLTLLAGASHYREALALYADFTEAVQAVPQLLLGSGLVFQAGDTYLFLLIGAILAIKCLELGFRYVDVKEIAAGGSLSAAAERAEQKFQSEARQADGMLWRTFRKSERDFAKAHGVAQRLAALIQSSISKHAALMALSTQTLGEVSAGFAVCMHRYELRVAQIRGSVAPTFRPVEPIILPRIAVDTALLTHATAFVSTHAPINAAKRLEAGKLTLRKEYDSARQRLFHFAAAIGADSGEPGYAKLDWQQTPEFQQFPQLPAPGMARNRDTADFQ